MTKGKRACKNVLELAEHARDVGGEGRSEGGSVQRMRMKKEHTKGKRAREKRSV